MTEASAEPGTADKNCRILLCEDARGERTALAHFLRRAGYTVEESATGNSAIAALKSLHIDLVMLDLHMPDGDGFNVLNYLYEHRQALPVVLMTGLEPDQIEQKMRHLRRTELPAMLMKPINPTQLLDLLELSLSGNLPTTPIDDE